MFDQPGRTAVITGGNRGIGADVVEKLLQCRINVVLGMLKEEFIEFFFFFFCKISNEYLFKRIFNVKFV